MSSGIGQALRAARRDAGKTLKDVALDTKIRETYLAAMEAEEFDSLGEPVYARGFLVSYAKYLGLDANPLVEEYREHHERPEEPLPPAPRPILDRDPARSQRVVIGVVVTVIAIAVLVWLYGRGDGEAAAVVAAWSLSARQLPVRMCLHLPARPLPRLDGA